jgi:hypothetical protein
MGSAIAQKMRSSALVSARHNDYRTAQSRYPTEHQYNILNLASDHHRARNADEERGCQPDNSPINIPHVIPTKTPTIAASAIVLNSCTIDL